MLSKGAKGRGVAEVKERRGRDLSLNVLKRGFKEESRHSC